MCKMGAIPYMAILAELASDDVLDAAHDWLCRRRRAYPADADVWSFRQAWAREKDKLKAGCGAAAVEGDFDFLGYRFDPEGLSVAKNTV